MKLMPPKDLGSTVYSCTWRYFLKVPALGMKVSTLYTFQSKYWHLTLLTDKHVACTNFLRYRVVEDVFMKLVSLSKNSAFGNFEIWLDCMCNVN